MKTRNKKYIPTGVGQPQTFYLNMFGELIFGAFGSCSYLIGSATRGKRFRDVDVRLILEDEEWVTHGFGDPLSPGAKWAAFCMAFSALGRHMTGLPIDFQIQQMSYANKKFKGSREALLWIYRK